MALLYRMRVAWSGSPIVGPGLSTFYFENVLSSYPTDVLALYTAIRSYVPVGVTWSVPNAGDVIDEETGVLTGAWSTGTAGTETSTGVGGFAQGVGARIAWHTATIRGGRRVRGSTFLVPLRSGAYDTAGTIDSTILTALRTAAQTLLTATAADQRIWSQPRPNLVGAGVPIVAVQVPDTVSWLRSRRT